MRSTFLAAPSMPQGQPARVARNHHIQALRGIAASLVVLDHSLGPLIERGFLPQWLDSVRFSVGGLGVYTFFVISGFIMINMSYNDFGHWSKSVSFAERRIIRIVPTYWIATVVAFAMYMALPLSRHITWLDFVQSLLFIPYSSNPVEDMQPVLAQGWTLNYEAFFYVLFTIALLFPRRIGLPGLFVSFAAIVVAGSWLKSWSDLSPATTISAFLSDPMILLFAVGMAIGVVRKEYPNFYVKYPLQITLALLTVQIALLLIFKVPPRVVFPECIWTWLPGIGAVICCALAAPSPQNRFERVSEMLGDASYSTYLFHVFVVFALAKVIPITAITAIPYVLLSLICSTGVGILFFLIIERSMTRYLRDHLTRRRAGQ